MMVGGIRVLLSNGISKIFVETLNIRIMATGSSPTNSHASL